MTRQESPWVATTERAEHAPLAGDVTVDVVVVGGGIAGLTTATYLHDRGARVALVEADRIGSGTTGGTTGKLTSQHGLTYHELMRRRGERAAAQYAAANQSAIDAVAKLAESTDADCAFTRAPAFVYATTADDATRLAEEHAAASHLGLPAVLTDEIDLPVPIVAALRFDDQAHFHAGRYLDALGRALAAGGALVCEHTRATEVHEQHDHVAVHTQHGVVRAAHAVVTTLLPITDRGAFFAKVQPTRAYGIAARLATDVLHGMHVSVATPLRSTRPWTAEGGGPGVVVVGESHRTGTDDATPARWEALETWARAHLPVLEVDYRWSAQDFTGPDRVPYVGRSPRATRTFVATGFRKWGLTNATAAATVLADLVEGREHAWLAAFDATRIGGPATVGQLVAANLQVGVHYVGGRLGRRNRPPAATLAADQGGVVELDGEAVGAYRDNDGTLHAVDLTCTHLGCTVAWNAAERSWDCPCHGSRFGVDGEVLAGPAVAPLTRKDPERK